MSNVIDLDKLLQEGRPFAIKLETATDDAEVEFDLDTDTYDTVPAFFKDKMLWVSAIKVVPGTGDKIEALRFDEIMAWNGDGVADVGLDLSGIPYESATPIGIAQANVKDVFGNNYLPVRNSFQLKNESGASAKSTVYLWGIYTERTA